MIKYAKLRRNCICAGIILAALSYIPLSNAAYTQLTPPVGWSAGAAGASSEFNMLLSKPVGSAAGATISSSRISALASLSVNGRSVPVPVSMQIANGGSKFLAGRIGAALAIGGSAALTGGLSVAAALLLPVAIEWWQKTEYEWDGNKWLQKRRILNGYWRDTWGYGEYPTPDAACNARLTNVHAEIVPSNPSLAYCYYGPGQVAGSVSRVGEEVVEVKVVPYEPKVKEALETEPLPEKLPEAIPLSWPVDSPIINPSPSNKSQPLFIPTGNPVPNPSYDPTAAPGPDNQPYKQPGVRVVPAPTPDDPWRVDVQPVDRPTSSPDPTKPVTDGGDNPGDKPSDDKPGLCDMYPDILACAKPELDTPGGEIPKAQRSVELSDTDLFGGGSCPANVYATVGHQYLQVWNWDQSCYYIVKYLKPVILVLGAFTALMIVSGGTKE